MFSFLFLFPQKSFRRTRKPLGEYPQARGKVKKIDVAGPPSHFLAIVVVFIPSHIWHESRPCYKPAVTTNLQLSNHGSRTIGAQPKIFKRGGYYRTWSEMALVS